jgi:hypothetical protein
LYKDICKGKKTPTPNLLEKSADTTKFKMSDYLSPYAAGITLEEALAGARALRAENVAAEVEHNIDIDEEIMTEEEMATVMADYAPRKPSTSAPPVVARPKFNPRRLVFRSQGKEQMLTTKHGPDGLSAFDNTAPPSSTISFGHAVAQSFSAGTGKNHADDLGQDTDHSGSLAISAAANAVVSSYVGHASSHGYLADEEENVDSSLGGPVGTHPGNYPYEQLKNDPAFGGPFTTPNGRQSVNYPVGNAILSGYFDPNGAFVVNYIPARFQTDYVSPYTHGSVRYFDATGYPHGRGLEVGELNPGHMTTTSAPSSYAEHASNNIDVNGGYEDIENPFYPDPETNTTALSYVAHSFSPATQGQFADTTPSNFGDYIGQQQMGSEQYTDHNNYLAHPEQLVSNLYTGTPQPMASPQQMAPIQYQAKRKPREKVDKETTKAGKPQKIYKKTFGTLYNEQGKLRFPIQHYREYMNGLREMNGQFAESTLAPIPCQACTERGLTCSVLSREGDHGKVFTRMRKPWHNQQVSNYIVCGNCWGQAGTPQTCSFWRRPEGKEIPAMPYSRR